MELKFIGTGSCFNFDRGNNSAYMKWGENNESMLLIDCGCDVCEKIVRNNLLDGVNNLYVAITHLHDDHSGSLGQLIDYCYHVKNIIVDLIFPPQNTIKTMLSTKMVSIDKYQFYGYYSYTNEGTSWFDLGKKGPMIKFTPTSHKEGYDSFSILLSDEDTTILYTGDTNSLDINDIDNKFGESGDKFKLYTECTFTPEFSNVHVYYKTLFGIPEEYRKNVIVMHLDNNSENIQELREAGFNIAESELIVYTNTIHKISPSIVQQFNLNSYKSNIIKDENIEIDIPIMVPEYTTEELLKEALNKNFNRFSELLNHGSFWVSLAKDVASSNMNLKDKYTIQISEYFICKIIKLDIKNLKATCVFNKKYLEKFNISEKDLYKYTIEFLSLGVHQYPNHGRKLSEIFHITYPVLRTKIGCDDKQEDENIEVELPIRVPSYTTEENLKEELSNGTDKDRFDEMIKYGTLWASGVEPKVSDTLTFLSQDPSERICRIINIDVEKLEVTCIFRQSYLDKFDIDKNNLSSYEIEFLALGNFVGRRTMIQHLTYPVLKKKIEFKKDKLKKELKDPKDHDIQVSTGTIKDIITHPEKYKDMFKED